MYIAIWGVVLLIILFSFIPFVSGGVTISLILIFAVVALIVIIKRIVDIRKHKLSQYNDNELIIQNVQKGGVIKLANIDGQTEDLELKVINRNLYMEGDYSWYELECINANGEKFWVDVDDDDDLVVSIVIEKPPYGELNFSSSLKNIDENESGYIKYRDRKFNYLDSGDAVFYKHCDDKKKEKLYYYDFKSGCKYLLTVEEWKSSDHRIDKQFYISQIVKPASITVFSTKGD